VRRVGDRGRVPRGLPDLQHDVRPRHISSRYVCSYCKTGEVDIYPAPSGMRGRCKACKMDWPVSASVSGGGSVPITPARGLSKQTIVPPNFSKIFDRGDRDDLEEEDY